MRKLIVLLLLLTVLPMLSACSRTSMLFSGIFAGVILSEAIHHDHQERVVIVEEHHHYHDYHRGYQRSDPHCYD